jgi:hypothetical protein
MPVCEKEMKCSININQGFVRCRGCRLEKCLLMGMDSNKVQLDGVVNGENVEIMRRYLEKINAKQRELQSHYGTKIMQTNVKVLEINFIKQQFLLSLLKVNIGKWQFPLPRPKADQFPRPFGNSILKGIGISTTIDRSL